MRIILHSMMLLLAALAVATPALAATPSEFYLALLKRGASEVEAGRHSDSVTPLRLAAFGFVDSVENYETAQVYLTVAYDRLSQPDQAREAATRVVAAERVERRYATLPLPPSIRTAFDAIARKILASSDVAALTAPPVAPSQVKPIVPPAATARATTPAQKPPTAVAGTNGVKTVAPTETPKQIAKPVEKPAVIPGPPRVEEKPAPTPIVSKPPAQTPKSTPTPTPVQVKPTPPVPAQVKPTPSAPVQVKPAPPAPQPQPSRVDVPARLATAERALTAANLAAARRVYRELLAQPSLDRVTLIRIGEGLYRARDFGGALSAFQRLGPLRAGEEPYRYYIAVALFETGDYERARKELAAALPHIEITPDVARYRSKIEGSVN